MQGSIILDIMFSFLFSPSVGLNKMCIKIIYYTESVHQKIEIATLIEQSYTLLNYCLYSGGSRIFERWFPSVVDPRCRVVDPRCRGLGAQPPAAEEVLIFTSIQSIENYNILYL